jgi:catechol 2,3-dioxygenase-like lactoylglutathione lyase family enzyme
LHFVARFKAYTPFMPIAPPPELGRIVETGLYVKDLERSRGFYCQQLGLSVLLDASPRLVALDAGPGSVLLLFQRGHTDASEIPAGRIPGHGATGVQHLAFGVDEAGLALWEKRLVDLGIQIESRTAWSPHARSVYFRDPDGHSLELITPGFWRNF